MWSGTFILLTTIWLHRNTLICAIQVEKTDIRVLLTGEISDELFGYKYTDFAPDEEAFQLESQKRIKEPDTYDVPGADRWISPEFSGSKGPVWGYRFCKVCNVYRSQAENESIWKGKIFVCHALLKMEIIFLMKSCGEKKLHFQMR